MTFKAAFLDDKDLFVRIDDLDDATQLTARHLPQITQCDLPPGKYQWIADPGAPYDGAFWPVAYVKQTAAAVTAARATKD